MSLDAPSTGSVTRAKTVFGSVVRLRSTASSSTRPDHEDRVTKPSRGERLRYVFDDFMARGTIALILGLFLVAAIGVLLVTIVVAVFFRSDAPLSDLLWNSLMRTLDPGTMGGDEGSFGFLVGMLAVTLFGIFIISALIGIINTGLEGKLAQLRKGRSHVVETGHTVILGWSQEIFTIVSELVVANANLRRSAIVILADRDKGEMDDEIRSRLPPPGEHRSSAAPAIRWTSTISRSRGWRRRRPSWSCPPRTTTRTPTSSRRCWR